MDYPDLDILVRALLAQGRKVEAVKQVRQATLWGLKQSKDYVEAMAESDGFTTGVAGLADYAAFSDAELLAALEYAGRAPHVSLIQECLARREALTPGLLALLGGGVDKNWPLDDPRWYRKIHAGQLLCAFREPAALPIFARLLREEDRDVMLEWFDFAIPRYFGSLAVPMLVELLDVQDEEYLSGSACEMLGHVALRHPEERDPIIAILCSHLPALDAAGKPLVTRSQRRDPPVLWAWIIDVFISLQYAEEHARVKALFDANLLDVTVFGDWEDYREAFAPDAPPMWESEYVYDIVENYEHLYAQEQAISRRAASVALDTLLGPPSAVRSLSREPIFTPVAPKVGRNDPCPCGSGKKYKHCCGKKG